MFLSKFIMASKTEEIKKKEKTTWTEDETMFKASL